ncbi:MAG: hypothetical protein QOC84_2059, partial [Bradyrhizobium sp.]|nr:hypothetical protein [Bradyrhizobium sp.]
HASILPWLECWPATLVPAHYIRLGRHRQSRARGRTGPSKAPVPHRAATDAASKVCTRGRNSQDYGADVEPAPRKMRYKEGSPAKEPLMDTEKTEPATTGADKGVASAPLAEKIIDLVVDGAAALTKAAAKGAARRVAGSAKKKADNAAVTVAKKMKKAASKKGGKKRAKKAVAKAKASKGRTTGAKKKAGRKAAKSRAIKARR